MRIVEDLISINFFLFKTCYEQFRQWNFTSKRERHMLASICASRSQKPRKQYSRTVKRLFTGFQTNFQRLWRNMERKPLKSHANVVGRLSNNDFSTFQAIRNFFEKSR